MTTTKQQQSDPVAEHIGPITPKLLRKRFDLIDQFVDTIHKANENAGLDARRNAEYVPKLKLMSRDKLTRFLDQAVNPKTQKWYTLQSLLDAGVISELELENQFKDKVFPTFSLARLTRFHTPTKGDYLQRFLNLTALDREANVVTSTWIYGDYWNTPEVHYELVPSDAGDNDSKPIRVGVVTSGPGHEPTGRKNYLLPFSPQNVDEILKYSPAAGDFADRNNGTCLCLHKEGEVQPDIQVDNLTDFNCTDFVSLWKETRTPTHPSTIQVNGKDLLNYVRINAGNKEGDVYQ